MNKFFVAVSPILVLLIIFISIYIEEQSEWNVDISSNKANAQHNLNYHLSELKTMDATIVHIEEQYVEPHRINRRKMVAAALEEVQKEVPEILVQITKNKDGEPTEINIQVNDHKKKFVIDQILNRYQLLFVFKDIFSFIEPNIKHFKKIPHIEYAAINGMLSTLDPHSNLLDPDAYEEMKMSNQGNFGGLGIVIGVRDGALTVINPIEDTPASRAGIKAGDKIVQINLDSTINMSLNDAVDMMRGVPGTDVDIYVMREGWKEPKKHTLTRATIKVKSSTAPIELEGDIGLLHIDNFQGNTMNELNAAIEKFKKDKKFKGFILDLRGNPGGLLNQAVEMVDLFVEEGIITKTVGYGNKVQEPRMATKKGTLSDLPIVVLVDQGSASASEIVSGALKNLKRALIVGEKTFGKGSVQLVFDNPDNSALKLTIAQYLTPGDISIQSVGIKPHIALKEMRITKDEEKYFYHPIYRGEGDLPEHLSNEYNKLAREAKSLIELSFLQDPEIIKKKQDRPSETVIDFEIELAKEILMKTKSAKLDDLLSAAEKIIKEKQKVQDLKLQEILKSKNINWNSDSDLSSTPSAEVSYQIKPENAIVKAGESFEITVTVKNTGTKSIDKLHAVSFSRNDALEGHEFIFGQIMPNESKSWTTTIKTQPYFYGRKDDIEIRFVRADEKTSTISSLKLPVEIQQYPDPYLTFSYFIKDESNDGILSVGEKASLTMQYQNEGMGETIELIGSLSNEGKQENRSLFIQRGRISPEKSALKKGDQDQVTFEFKVKDDAKNDASVILNMYDAKLREGSLKKIVLPVISPKRIQKSNLSLKSQKSSWMLKAQPCDQCDVVALSKDPILKSTSCISAYDSTKSCEWYEVKDQNQNRYWVSQKEISISTEEASENHIQPIYQFASPLIELNQPLPTFSSEKEIPISVSVSALSDLQDILLYVNQRKIYYKPSSELSDKKKHQFEINLPLEDGENKIVVYARESEEVVSQKLFIVHRPDGEKEKNKKYFDIE
jgi:carboxyl-terminal processing protease